MTKKISLIIAFFILFLTKTIYADDYKWDLINALGRNDFKKIENILKENVNIMSSAEKRVVMSFTLNFRELHQAHKETEKGFRELQKAQKETQRIVGDLGNKFGDEAEYTMIPGLPEKFQQFGFDFGAISRNRKINNDKYGIHAEIDAFLENGTQAMAVEVKAKLQTGDVDDHINRMEKLRKDADIFGDKRELLGALTATVVQEIMRLKTAFTS